MDKVTHFSYTLKVTSNGSLPSRLWWCQGHLWSMLYTVHKKITSQQY